MLISPEVVIIRLLENNGDIFILVIQKPKENKINEAIILTMITRIVPLLYLLNTLKTLPLHLQYLRLVQR